MMISLTAPFLLFPTRRDAPLCKLHFLLSGRKVQEADVRLCAPDDADFVGCMMRMMPCCPAFLSPTKSRYIRRITARCCTSRPRSAGTTTRTV